MTTARGDQHEQSDIDFRIEKGELKGMFALCVLQIGKLTTLYQGIK